MPRKAQASATPTDSDYTEQPLYGGAQYTQAQEPTAPEIPLQTPLSSTIQQGISAQVATARALGEALIERNDTTLALQRKAEMAQIEAAFKSELETSSKAADGTQGSFFNADHTPNVARQNEILNKYNRLTANLTRGYVGQQARLQAQEQQTSFRSSLMPVLVSELLKQSSERATTAFNTNFYALLASGQFEAAIGSLPSGFQSGAVAPGDAQGYYNAKAIAKLRNKSKSARATGGQAAVNATNDELDGYSD